MSKPRFRRRLTVIGLAIVWVGLSLADITGWATPAFEAWAWVTMFGVASAVSALALLNAFHLKAEAEKTGRVDYQITANGHQRTEVVRLIVCGLMLTVGVGALTETEWLVVPALFGAAACLTANSILSHEYRRELRQEIAKALE